MDNNKKRLIIDVFSSDFSAFHHGLSRVEQVNKTSTNRNLIICGPGDYVEQVRNTGIETHVVDMQHASIDFFKDQKSIRRLSELLKKLAPDIVHTHNSKGGLIGTKAASSAGVPLIMHQFHGFLFKRYARFKSSLTRFVEYLYSRNCNVLLFQSKNDLATARSMRMTRHAKLIYLGNGIDTRYFNMMFNRRDPKELGCISLVSIARMDTNKNHEMIFRSLESLEGRVPFELHLIGTGSLEERHKRRTDESQLLKGRVIFHGEVKKGELSSIAGKCHVNLLTSRQEGKPRSPMEAAFLGIPTIATNIDGTREVVIHGKTGFLVELDDYFDLAKKIQKLYEDPELLRSLSNASRKYADENFDERKLVSKLCLIYEMALNSRWAELDDYADFLENEG